MAQKIIKIGSSAGVTIPKKLLEKTNLAVGDHITISIDESTGKLQIEPSDTDGVVVDRELYDWTKGFIEQYKPALEELADK